MAQIRENRVKKKLQRGEVATIVSGYNSSDMIDFLGPLGFDGVWIECEHGPVDFADIPDLSRAADLWGMTSVVRVNKNDYGTIYRTFDVGAQGIVVPHVNTAEEARAVVNAAKFHPLGARGMFTSRQGYGVPDYFHKANDNTLVIVLIEDIEAVNNLDDVLKVDHIDVFFVAPSDLAQSMGLLGQLTHPQVQSTIDRALEKIVSSGRTAGTLVNDANVERYLQKGVRCIMTGWTQWVVSGSRAFLGKVASASG